jgi:hypothetical protein
MLNIFRPRAFAALFVAFAAIFATPALAAEGQAAPAAAASVSITSLPNLSTVTVPQVAGEIVERPQTASAIAITAGRPLRDLVISFVDYGNYDAERLCLAKAVYFEARSESLEGQLAVAEVVLNRSVSGVYPPSICGVVTQPAQFSFVRAGRMPEPKTASDAWHKALAIADIAAKKLSPQLSRDVLWYHATYVAPSWGRAKTRAARIGTHIFYS